LGSIAGVADVVSTKISVAEVSEINRCAAVGAVINPTAIAAIAFLRESSGVVLFVVMIALAVSLG